MYDFSTDPIAFVPTPKEIASLMVSLISKPNHSSVLDPGCGEGVFISSLQDRNFSSITGIELNRELYNFCRHSFSGCEFINGDFLQFPFSSQFDVIIGNPPYSHFNSLPEDMKKVVYSITQTKETDIYYAFIIKAIELLKEEGELIFIVPYGFFCNTHAKRVREVIAKNGFFDTIIDLDEVNLFKGELPETIIFKFIKTQKRERKPTQVLKIKTRRAKPLQIKEHAIDCLNNKKENAFFNYFEKRFDYSANTWSTFPGIQIDHFVQLGSLAFVGVGMVSGFDKAFRLEEEEIKSFTMNEQEQIIPFVKGEHCKGFYVEGQTFYFLVERTIRTEREFKESYPTFYSRILPYKEEMKNRYLPRNGQWFHWQALRNIKTYRNTLNKPKIFIPTLDRSKKNRFSLTYEPLFPSGDVITIIPYEKKDVFFLLGYLNSDFFRKYYFSYGAKRGNRISYTQRLLSTSKIPRFTVEVKNTIAENAKQIFIEGENNQKREKIERIILQAFEENLFESI